MAKIYGLFGSMTGKLADVVMTVRNGVQVARKYQPVVANPQSPAQVAVRAQLKMLSQLSAAYAPIIAIRRQGAVTARNIFTRVNFPFSSFDGSKATIPLADVLLTNSVSGLPDMEVSRSSATGVSVVLKDDASKAWERVIYVMVAKSASQEVYPLASVVASDAGTDGTFPAVLPYSDKAIAVYAYGARFNNSAARVYFDELMTPTAEAFAQVLTSTKFNEADVAVSETRGVYLEVGTDSAETTGAASYAITAVAADNSGNPSAAGGSVSGAGTYPYGSQVTLLAQPNAGWGFLGWYVNGQMVANTLSYNFVVTGAVDAQARFGTGDE